MRTQWMVSLILATTLVAAFLTLESCKGKAAQCPLCDRDIHQHMGVSITHNSIPLKTCCMSCALTYKAQARNVAITTATDFLTDAPLDPQKAFYVVASDVSPCTQDIKVNKVIREPHSVLYACYDRCEPGILAFRNKSAAEAFQKQHGGYLQQFEQLPNWIPARGGHSHDQ